MKKYAGIISLLLALVLLCGCGVEAVQPHTSLPSEAPLVLENLREHKPFDELEYSRPDAEHYKALVKAACAALEGESTNAVISAVYDCVKYAEYFSTMSELAAIYNSLDITDTFYAEETGITAAMAPIMINLSNELYAAASVSAYADRLENETFWQSFCISMLSDEDYSERVSELRERENELVQSYYEIIGENDGSDPMRRWRKIAPEVAGIYIELVKVREELADELGYDSYEEYCYAVEYMRDYSPEDAENYLAAIKRYLVPLYRTTDAAAYSRAAYRDSDIDESFAVLSSAAEHMGGKIKSAFDFMLDYGLYDVSVSDVKSPGAFTTYLISCDEAFLFANSSETVGDIFNFSHEFGHFTDFYSNGGENAVLEIAESYSMAFEFLSLMYSEKLSDAERAEYLKTELFNALSTFCEQAAFTEFERRAFEIGSDKLTLEKLRELSAELSMEYGFGEEYYREFYSYVWIDISHFFEVPFYMLSYSVSAAIALQIYEAECLQSGAGLEKYNAMLSRESMQFSEFVDEFDFISPVEGENLSLTAEFIANKLHNA